jgi:transposase
LPDSLTEPELELLLFPPPSAADVKRPEPDWNHVHQELRRAGVTLGLLWQEYKAVHPNGYQYSQFCNRYRDWSGTLDLPMRQTHKAGEKLFVDYAGQTMPVVNRQTGQVHEAQIFVAASGASNYTYTEGTWTQTLPDWIGAHVHCFAFMGGVHEVIVPDNLKSGVCVFRSKARTDSGGKRAVISVQSAHRFGFNPRSDSGGARGSVAE